MSVISLRILSDSGSMPVETSYLYSTLYSVATCFGDPSRDSRIGIDRH